MTSPARTSAEGTAGGLDLPPGWQAVGLREMGDAMAHAAAIAGEAGAGTLVWVRRFDLVELAVVLEPEGPLSAARRAIYAVMNAAADALATHVPPERPIDFAWPDTLLLDGAILGGARLAAPPGADEAAEADWLVAGLTLRIVMPHLVGAGRGSRHALDHAAVRGTSLEIEGFEQLDGKVLVESFTRHLMVQVDRWLEKGFGPVGEDYLARLVPETGVRRGIDGNGDLLVRRIKAPREAERRPLLAALAAPQWLDPQTGAPWL